MPNFTAQTRAEIAGITPAPPAPGEATPAVDMENMRELGATEMYPRFWQYRHRDHTMADMLRPDYFGDAEARSRLRLGDEIHLCAQAGKKRPSEWERALVVIDALPTVREQPVVVVPIVYGLPATNGEAGELM